MPVAAILLAVLIFSACGAKETAVPAQATPVPEATTVPEAKTAETPPAPETSAGVEDEAMPKQINGYLVFADEALMSDPPEDGIDMFEAIRRLSLQEDPLAAMPGNDKSEFAYKYDGIVDVKDEECYSIFLLMKDVNGEFSEGTDICLYAVSTSGKIYIFHEESGEYAAAAN